MYSCFTAFWDLRDGLLKMKSGCHPISSLKLQKTSNSLISRSMISMPAFYQPESHEIEHRGAKNWKNIHKYTYSLSRSLNGFLFVFKIALPYLITFLADGSVSECTATVFQKASYCIKMCIIRLTPPGFLTLLLFEFLAHFEE